MKHIRTRSRPVRGSRNRLREKHQRDVELFQRMQKMLLRIGYPKRGTPDEAKDIQDFADEIQNAFKQWELDENYDGTPPDGREWPQAANE